MAHFYAVKIMGSVSYYQELSNALNAVKSQLDTECRERLSEFMEDGEYCDIWHNILAEDNVDRKMDMWNKFWGDIDSNISITVATLED